MRSPVAGAGDVNGDGFADVIVGRANPKTRGQSYVVFGGRSSPAKIDLSLLDGSNGFRLVGQHRLDLSGSSVAGAGDVNGDGFDDVIVCAYRADPGGKTDAGSSYVVFGRSSGFPATSSLTDLDGSNGFRLDGVGVGDSSGHSVAGAGDVNGDGFDDIIIGAPWADLQGYDSGSSYVVFGHTSDSSKRVNLANLDGRNGFSLDGGAISDRAGYSVAGAGDVNADGFDDVIIGASGADRKGTGLGSSYVVFGHASGFPKHLKLSNLDGSNGFRLDGISGLCLDAPMCSDFFFRVSVASAGDVNGDGYADLIIGALYASPHGKTYAGSSYVVFGHASAFPRRVNLSSLDGNNGFRLDGISAWDWSGRSVARAGDVNHDGFDDIVLGASGANANAGAGYVVFGRAAGFPKDMKLSTLDGSNGFRLDGPRKLYGEWLVAGAGDVNGDAVDDVIVSASSESSYVIFGHASGATGTRNRPAGGR
jgi:hypothetical protein